MLGTKPKFKEKNDFEFRIGNHNKENVENCYIATTSKKYKRNKLI